MVTHSLSLDRQLKVYSVEDYHVMHSMTYPAPILSMAMSVSGIVGTGVVCKLKVPC